MSKMVLKFATEQNIGFGHIVQHQLAGRTNPIHLRHVNRDNAFSRIFKEKFRETEFRTYAMSPDLKRRKTLVTAWNASSLPWTFQKMKKDEINYLKIVNVEQVFSRWILSTNLGPNHLLNGRNIPSSGFLKELLQ